MVFVMFFLEFLNSYRNFGLRFVQYQYINNEFGLDDVQVHRQPLHCLARTGCPVLALR